LETCKQEYSIENISCWKDVEDFKKERSIDVKRKKVVEIYNLYLNGNRSQLEVNVSSAIHIEIQKDMNESNYENIFDQLSKDILTNLRDTFQRLTTSERYQSYKKHQELLKTTNVAE